MFVNTEMNLMSRSDFFQGLTTLIPYRGRKQKEKKVKVCSCARVIGAEHWRVAVALRVQWKRETVNKLRKFVSKNETYLSSTRNYASLSNPGKVRLARTSLM
jgi:hypothetical protein